MIKLSKRIMSAALASLLYISCVFGATGITSMNAYAATDNTGSTVYDISKSSLFNAGNVSAAINDTVSKMKQGDRAYLPDGNYKFKETIYIKNDTERLNDVEILLNGTYTMVGKFNAMVIDGDFIDVSVDTITSGNTTDAYLTSGSLANGVMFDQFNYSSFNVNNVQGFDKGIWCNPQLENTGICYNKFTFGNIEYCYQPISLAIDTANPYTWVNENSFTGGRLQGAYGIYTIRGQSQSDEYNNNTYENISFENIAKDGMYMNFSSYSTLKNSTFTDVSGYYINERTNSKWMNYYLTQDTPSAKLNITGRGSRVYSNIYNTDNELFADGITMTADKKKAVAFQYDYTNLQTVTAYNCSATLPQNLKQVNVSSSVFPVTLTFESFTPYENYNFLVKVEGYSKPIIIKDSNGNTLLNDVFKKPGNYKVVYTGGAFIAYENNILDMYSMKSINVIGDSISHGANAPDIPNQSYVGLIKQAVNANYGVNNYGFTSMLDSISNNSGTYRELHSIAKSGYWSVLQTGDFLGAYALRASSSSAYLTVTPQKDYKYIAVFYEQIAGGGSFDIKCGGKVLATIDTNGSTRNAAARTQLIAVDDSISKNGIVIQKKDTKNVTITGMGYYNSPDGIVVNNYARSGLQLMQVSDDILKAMCKSDTVIFSMGHNDMFVSGKDAEFTAKIDKVITYINESGAKLIVNDFTWNLENGAHVRTELKRLASECGGVFNDYTYSMAGKIQDGSHPYVEGHRILADTIISCLDFNNDIKDTTKLATAYYGNPEKMASDGTYDDRWNLLPENRIEKTLPSDGRIRKGMTAWYKTMWDETGLHILMQVDGDVDPAVCDPDRFIISVGGAGFGGRSSYSSSDVAFAVRRGTGDGDIIQSTNWGGASGAVCDANFDKIRTKLYENYQIYNDPKTQSFRVQITVPWLNSSDAVANNNIGFDINYSDQMSQAALTQLGMTGSGELYWADGYGESVKTPKKMVPITLNNSFNPFKLQLTVDSQVITNGTLVMSGTEKLTVADIKSYFQNSDFCKVYNGETLMSDNQTVGTGCKIKMVLNNNVADTQTLVISGDTNGDGACNIIDLVIVKKSLAGQKFLTVAEVVGANFLDYSKTTVTSATLVQLKKNLLAK